MPVLFRLPLLLFVKDDDSDDRFVAFPDPEEDLEKRLLERFEDAAGGSTGGGRMRSTSRS